MLLNRRCECWLLTQEVSVTGSGWADCPDMYCSSRLESGNQDTDILGPIT